MKNLRTVLLAFGFVALVLMIAVTVYAHPGNLDKNGCHKVSKKYTYPSGVVAKAGVIHCHRGVGKMKFDDKEVLRDAEELLKEKTPVKKGKTK